MKLGEYTKKLSDFIKFELSNSTYDFVVLKELLEGKSNNFNLTIFYLLDKIIRTNCDSNFQILIPDKFYKNDLLNPVLIALSAIKYAQNINIPDNLNRLGKDDIFLLSGNKICQLTDKGNPSSFLKHLNSNKGGSVEKRTSELEHYPKLRSTKEFKYNRNTEKYIEQYSDFYKLILKPTYRFLSKFQRKTVLITSTSILNSEQKLILPFRYNQEKFDSIPVEPLIEIFNTYEQARPFLKSTDTPIDEVIIVGYEKYQNIFGQIINDKNDGLFKKVILIGSKKVKSNDFKFWQWTNKELQLLSENESWEGQIERFLVQSDQIEHFKQKLENFKNEIIQYQVDQVEMEAINNYFIGLFSQQLSDKNKQVFLQYILSLFEEDNDFDDALSALESEFRKKYRDRYIKIITDFLVVFENGKVQAIKDLRQIDKFYKIVAPKRNKEEIQRLVKDLGYRKHKVITQKDLENLIIDANPSKPNKTVFVIPYVRFKYNNPLWNFHLYQKTRALGDLKLLCYKGIEEERLNMFNQFYRKQEIYRLKHPDRNWFVDIKYEMEEEIDEEESDILEIINAVGVDEEQNKEELKKVKHYFKSRFKSLSSFGNKIDLGDEDSEDVLFQANNSFQSKCIKESKRKYKLIFSDGSYVIVGEHEIYAQKDGRIFTIQYAKDLKTSDRIITDWLLDLKFIFKILENYPEFKIEVQKLAYAGKLWQGWLRGLLDFFARKRTEKEATAELYKQLNLSVQQKTFETWLSSKDPFMFPRSNADLENIIQLKRKYTPNKEAIDKEIEKLKKGSAALLNQVKQDLTAHICGEEKGTILNQLKPNDLKKLLSKKQLNQITKIETI